MTCSWCHPNNTDTDHTICTRHATEQREALIAYRRKQAGLPPLLRTPEEAIAILRADDNPELAERVADRIEALEYAPNDAELIRELNAAGVDPLRECEGCGEKRTDVRLVHSIHGDTSQCRKCLNEDR